MCEALKEAIDLANLNRQSLIEAIDALSAPDAFKVRFFELADERGFRSGDENFRQMEEIGKTKSDMCLLLLEGKAAGLINAYLLATELDDEKQRAEAITFLREKSKKKTVTVREMWQAIATVRKDAGGLFNE